MPSQRYVPLVLAGRQMHFTINTSYLNGGVTEEDTSVVCRYSWVAKFPNMRYFDTENSVNMAPFQLIFAGFVLVRVMSAISCNETSPSAYACEIVAY